MRNAVRRARAWACPHFGSAVAAIAVVLAAGAVAPALGQSDIAAGRELYQQRNCRNCHTFQGRGARGPGPDLTAVHERRTREWLERWLRDPQAIEPGTIMPTFKWTPQQLDVMIDFLLSPATADHAAHAHSSAAQARPGVALVKSWLSLLLLLLSLVAAWSMLERLGTPARPWLKPHTALTVHRINGALFVVLFLVISWYCVRAMLPIAGEWTPRVTLHVGLAAVAIVVLGLKIVLAWRYPGLSNYLPPLGIILLVTTWMLAASSAGYYLVLSAGP